MSSKNRLVLNDDQDSGSLPAACEVAVPTRRKRPVELGIVPPDITPWSGGRAGRAARTLLPLAEPGALAGEVPTTPWRAASRVSDGSDLNALLVSHMPLAVASRG